MCIAMLSWHCADAFPSCNDSGWYAAVIRTALKSVAGKVTRGSLNVAKLAVFWAGVFIAARFILESN